MKVIPFCLVAIIILLSFFSCKEAREIESQKYWTENTSPQRIGNLVSDDLFTRKDFMMYETPEVKSVHYAEACAGFGAARLAGLLNDSIRLNRLSARYSRVIDENIVNTENHVDVNVYGILQLELYMQGKDKRFLEQGLHLADKQWEDPLDDGLTSQTRYWIDDVWMIGSLQVQAYRANGDMIYLDRAALELDTYLRKLQQPNGLFYHGEGAPFFWGRGNGWVAAGLAELLSELPESNVHYASILKGYLSMMNSLIEYQAEDGMWRQLIDQEEAWKETSSTAMFGYAFAVGVKKGLLPDSTFTPAYQKAWNALVTYLNEEGKITEVCVGTGKGDNIQYYLDRPRTTGDLHGQAPVLWFAYSILAIEL